MANKNAQNTDRRAMVEKMRQEQARKEKLRSMGILGFCVVIMVALLLAAGVPYLKHKHEQDALAKLKLSDIGVSASAAACDPVKTVNAQGSGKHLPIGTKIAYKQAPPAFGPHWPVWPGGGGGAPALRPMYTSVDRPQVEYLVHSLEHGNTIVWYDDTVKPGTTAYKDLQKLADKITQANYVIIAPWMKSDGGSFPAGKHIALTHWTGPSKQKGVWEYCGAPSGSVLSTFLKSYPTGDAPEPGVGQQMS